ncbi:hypothetical protein AB2L28_20720 [Kineococcus sp. TBRC 1896]|uniref:Uncharacterized protein n=1 Tax=Kineococcus mangrovi TaxID=1660183 RepID=A0ABV4IBT1_9ACTN
MMKLVGLNPDVLWTTGWSSLDDLDDLDDVDFAAERGQTGGCPECRALGLDHEGQDRP